ncbi:hypothetical protein HN011_012327 [Eciton burchellii]|nr:hypothetical protein HN011_012327 [Eciton burchellii]
MQSEERVIDKRIFALWLSVTASGTFRSISIVVGKYFCSAHDIDASHGKTRSDALHGEADRGSPCVFISDIVASMRSYRVMQRRDLGPVGTVLLAGVGDANARIRIGRKSNQGSIPRGMTKMTVTCLICICSSSAISILPRSEVRSFSLNFSGILESVATWDAARVCSRARILSIRRCHRKNSS